MNSLRVELPSDAAPAEIADIALALATEPGVAALLGTGALAKAIKVGGPSHAGLSLPEVEARQKIARASIAPAAVAYESALIENFGAWDAAVTLAQAGSGPGGQLSLDGALALQGKLWTLVERDARRTIRDAYRGAWKAGRAAAGVFKPMSRDESAELTRMYRKQQNYFINLLRDREQGTGKMDYARRINMYGKALRAAFWAGQVLADLSDAWWQWVPDAVEHCSDCVYLATGGKFKNGIYSARELAKLGVWPGSGDTQCLTHCRCELKKVDKPDGKAGGKSPSRDALAGGESDSFAGNGRSGRGALARAVDRYSWKHRGRR